MNIDWISWLQQFIWIIYPIDSIAFLNVLKILITINNFHFFQSIPKRVNPAAVVQVSSSVQVAAPNSPALISETSEPDKDYKKYQFLLENTKMIAERCELFEEYEEKISALEL